MEETREEMSVIVQRGYQDTFDILAREFGRRGISVFWDRRNWERRQRDMPVAVERRSTRRRRENPRWNVLHFCVVQLAEPPLD